MHFVWANRSKESLTLDVKHPEAKVILKAIDPRTSRHCDTESRARSGRPPRPLLLNTIERKTGDHRLRYFGLWLGWFRIADKKSV
jgi:hypothetical protein